MFIRGAKKVPKVVNKKEKRKNIQMNKSVAERKKPSGITDHWLSGFRDPRKLSLNPFLGLDKSSQGFERKMNFL